MALEVPLSPQPQTFSISMGGNYYQLTVVWNEPAQCWILNIADDLNVPLVSGIPMVTGADLLAQYKYLGIPGQLIVQTDHDTNAVPTFDNLGSEGHLYYIA